jgi:hypothetical protein
VAIFFLFLSFVFLLAEKQKTLGDKFLREKAALILSKDRLNSIYGFFAGVFFAAAVLTKWVPLIFLPGIWMLTTPGKRKYVAFGFMIGCAAMFGVFWPDVQNCFYTLSVYVANWEFAGFAFRWLRVATGSGTIARAVLATGFIITMIIIYMRCINAVRIHPSASYKIPLNSPLQKGDFDPPFFNTQGHKAVEEHNSIEDHILPLPRRERAGVRGGIYEIIRFFTPTLTLPHRWGGKKGNLEIAHGHMDILKSFYFTTMAFLLFTPTLHPWYALYLAAFLPFAAEPAGLVLSWSVFLAYRVVILYGLTGEWIENDWIPFLIIFAPAAAFAAGLMSKTAKHAFKNEMASS